jgi:tRNA dimethylallyltransferase
MGTDSNFLIVIVGATAVGKTDLAIRLAQYFDTQIISADSRQCYQEMNIGTAKPNKEELSLVRHHFINSHSIQNEYNAGLFEKDVLQLLGLLFAKKQIVVMVGGSGMYVKAVCEGLDAMPTINTDSRAILQKEFDLYGLSYLLGELKSKDPDYYASVDKANPQRIMRALEVIRATNLPYSSFRKNSSQMAANNKKQRDFQMIKIGLERPREELYARIDSRMDKMLEEGLLNEAKNLYPFRQLNALQTVGYKEIFDFIEEKQDWAETVRLLKRNSRHYAKRQLTWFGADEQIRWFAAHQFEEILAYIKNKLEKNQKK